MDRNPLLPQAFLARFPPQAAGFPCQERVSECERDWCPEPGLEAEAGGYFADEGVDRDSNLFGGVAIADRHGAVFE
jgi:hypothetical protein